jgi:hypothetical protein
MVVSVASTKILAFFLLKEREIETQKERDIKTESGTLRKIDIILFNIAPSNFDAGFL